MTTNPRATVWLILGWGAILFGAFQFARLLMGSDGSPAMIVLLVLCGAIWLFAVFVFVSITFKWRKRSRQASDGAAPHEDDASRH